MNANDVIESYVTDVALQLPRKQRSDVAFELRALLKEGLQDKAEAAGRGADAAIAIEFLHAFGRPEDVAARYRPTLTIIDPADGHAFVRATVIGLTIIWGVGLLQYMQQPIASGSDFLRALGQWWGANLLPSLWWPGLLVVSFGASSWLRRRSPQTSQWQPRSGNRIAGGRASLVLGIVGILCGAFVLIDPRWILDFFWGGHAAPAAYQALTYTDGFLGRQAPLLFVLILLNIPLLLAVIVKGRWSASLRRMETVLALATCAVLAWTVLDGPVFIAVASNQMMKLSMVLIIAFMLINFGVKAYRDVRPVPNQRMQSER